VLLHGVGGEDEAGSTGATRRTGGASDKKQKEEWEIVGEGEAGWAFLNACEEKGAKKRAKLRGKEKKKEKEGTKKRSPRPPATTTPTKTHPHHPLKIVPASLYVSFFSLSLFIFLLVCYRHCRRAISPGVRLVRLFPLG
jgi:hypothetical protein